MTDSSASALLKPEDPETDGPYGLGYFNEKRRFALADLIARERIIVEAPMVMLLDGRRRIDRYAICLLSLLSGQGEIILAEAEDLRDQLRMAQRRGRIERVVDLDNSQSVPYQL